jgi:signal transduction histidine kinase
VEIALAEERERRRIASCLHDEVGHRLALAILQARRLGRAEGLSEEARNALARLGGELEGAIAATRGLTSELASPVLYEIGLEAAFESLGDRLEAGGQARFHLACDPLTATLPKDTAIILYRIGEELLVNVAKHAGASHVYVRLNIAGDHLTFAVEDDGRGLGAQAAGAAGPRGGLGLAAIRDRVAQLGGRFEIASAPATGGTCAQVTLSTGLAR